LEAVTGKWLQASPALLQLSIDKEGKQCSSDKQEKVKPGDNSSLEERRRLYDNMQDAIIGGGICTDLETLEIRGTSL
jgi:hypothetical protein